MSSKKKLKPSLGFVTVPNDLVYWAQAKDLRYYNTYKAAKGILSYRHALQDLASYFNQIRVGQLRPEQKSISYFSKSWGWDWRKTLRFIVYCMSSLKNLDAGFYLQKLQSLAQKQAQKVKSYVYKKRGKEIKQEEPEEKTEDFEIEEAFFNAMREIATSNPEAYVAKIKANLAKRDPKTLEHFEQFKKDYLEKKKARELELKQKNFDFQKALRALTINKQKLGKWQEREGGFDVWVQGQEHHYQPLTFISKKEIVEEFNNA